MSKLFHGRVSDTSGALFTASKSGQIYSCFVSNTTASPVALTLWAFSSGTATDSNIILEPLDIPANETIGLPTVVAMAYTAGESVHGLAGTASALTVRISGA